MRPGRISCLYCLLVEMCFVMFFSCVVLVFLWGYSLLLWVGIDLEKKKEAFTNRYGILLDVLKVSWYVKELAV